jgi:hypothetical protein
MMFDQSLPAELLEIERELCRTRAAVNPALTARCLQVVRDELVVERRTQHRRRLLAAAAALLVGWHVSWWGAQSAWSNRAAAIDDAKLSAYAEQLHELAPELSIAETERQARLALFYGSRDWAGDRAFVSARPFGMQRFVD